MPIVNGLKRQFGDQIEFLDLDIDDRSLDDFRRQYGISGRTQYVLLDEQGQPVMRWFGPLDEEQLRADLAGFVAERQ